MKTRWHAIIFAVALGLSACGNPVPSPDVEVPQELEEEEYLAEPDLPHLDPENYLPVYMHEIIDPQPDDVILMEPTLIRFSGHSFGGIGEFEVRVDGSIIGTVPPSSSASGGVDYGHFFYGELIWTPSEYGQHLIAVRAIAQGFPVYSQSLEVQVTVLISGMAEEEPEIPDILQPDCLVPPELTSPNDLAYVGTQPDDGFFTHDFFQWDYPGSRCTPTSFIVWISKDEDFNWRWIGDTVNYHTGWPHAGINPMAWVLEPASQYFWTVYAKVSGLEGPHAPAYILFTGPRCASASELVPPELISPADGAELNELSVTLNYSAGTPKCLPDGYFIDLQTDPNFNGTTLVGPLSTPSTTVHKDGLEDCTMYYWRVAAWKGLNVGPYSETRSFLTNESGLCMTQPTTTAVIEALRDQQCLQGPDPDKYPIFGYFLSGETAPIVAQDLREAWWVIGNPDGDDYCFVRKEDNAVSGDTSGIPMWRDPEIEEEQPQPPPPLACKRELNKDQCLDAGGTWTESATSADWYCKCD